jgi:VanZ family protein
MHSKFYIWGGAVLAYAALIFFLSSLSSFPDALPVFWSADKVLHFIEYFIMGFLFYGWFSSFKGLARGNFPLAATVMVGIAYALTDEWHQSFVPGRDASAWDWMFDSLGVLAATFAGPFLLRRVNQKHD